MASDKTVVVVVADASVIVKWFVDEGYTEQALALRKDYADQRIDIACPSLISYEVLNALRYNPEFGQEDVKTAADALEKYQLRQYPLVGTLASICIGNAFAYGIPLYDSAYISLGQHLDCTVYTADQQMIDKAGKKVAGLKHISSF